MTPFAGYPDGLVGDIERSIARVLNLRGLDGAVRAQVNADDVASAVTDALFADVPILQVIEVVTDHPGTCIVRIESRMPTYGPACMVRWDAWGDRPADDQGTNGYGTTLSAAVEDALKSGTPTRPRT